jgi:hypothetical protein
MNTMKLTLAALFVYCQRTWWAHGILVLTEDEEAGLDR